MFWYNSGSLLQALNPTETLVDLSGEPFIANIAESFLPDRVGRRRHLRRPDRDRDGRRHPLQQEDLRRPGPLRSPRRGRSSPPTTRRSRRPASRPVGATFGDTWTSQLFVLADYYNVQAAVPDFAEQYTDNQTKYADTPAALAGFQRLQEAFEKGWYQEDFGCATSSRRAEAARRRASSPTTRC